MLGGARFPQVVFGIVEEIKVLAKKAAANYRCAIPPLELPSKRKFNALLCARAFALAGPQRVYRALDARGHAHDDVGGIEPPAVLKDSPGVLAAQHAEPVPRDARAVVARVPSCSDVDAAIRRL
jgi:hypothetical protein